MKRLGNLIIVAGSGRNVGKTEFVCRLILKVSAQRQVFALKVSAVYPDEGMYHGSHDVLISETLIEETRTGSDKDSSRMLQAGARRVFYLRAGEEQMSSGFNRFLTKIPPGAAIVCESGSLWRIVQPGLLVLVAGNDGAYKPRSAALIEQASCIVHSDGISGFREIGRIGFSDEIGWYLQAARVGQ